MYFNGNTKINENVAKVDVKEKIMKGKSSLTKRGKLWKYVAQIWKKKRSLYLIKREGEYNDED